MSRKEDGEEVRRARGAWRRGCVSVVLLGCCLSGGLLFEDGFGGWFSMVGVDLRLKALSRCVEVAGEESWH